MTREIRPLAIDDLSDLGRFLIAGFHAPADSVFAAPDVLRWKYLDPRGDEQEAPRSYLAHDEHGRIIGHLGIFRTTFTGDVIPGHRVPTLHMIDWLGSPEHRAVGASLMRKANQQTPTQFGLGGNEAGRTMGKRSGYVPQDPIPAYQRVLHPLHWLRVPGLRLQERGVRLVRELVRTGLSRPRPAQVRIELHKVLAFGPEIEPIVERARASAILTDRGVARLNHMLQFPRQAVSGWQLTTPPGQLCGFAILNLLPGHGGRTRLGKIVDCLLPDTDVRVWHGAIVALTRELERQGADLVQTFGGTPWLEEALRRSGFSSHFALEFNLRDRNKLLPAGTPFHLMPIDADYAYS